MIKDLKLIFSLIYIGTIVICCVLLSWFTKPFGITLDDIFDFLEPISL